MQSLVHNQIEIIQHKESSLTDTLDLFQKCAEERDLLLIGSIHRHNSVNYIIQSTYQYDISANNISCNVMQCEGYCILNGYKNTLAFGFCVCKKYV